MDPPSILVGQGKQGVVGVSEVRQPGATRGWPITRPGHICKVNA